MISLFFRLKTKICICRDNRSWKKLKQCGTERTSWGWEWRLLKSKGCFFFTIHVIKEVLLYALSLCIYVCTYCVILLCLYDDRTCQIHEEKVKTTEELLRRRELAVKTMEDTHDQRLKNELSRYFHVVRGSHGGLTLFPPVRHIQLVTHICNLIWHILSILLVHLSSQV